MQHRYSRRAFVSLSGTALLTAGLALAGCSTSSGSAAQPSAAEAATSALPGEVVSRDVLGSADPCDVRVGLLMGPPSMGLSQFLLAAQNGRCANNFSFSLNGVDFASLSASFNEGAFDIATLPSNIGPILYNNADLQNDYRVISVNNLGVLYVMTIDPSISSLDDMAGRRVYAYGEGGTPEYQIEALLKKRGIEDAINVEFKSTPFEVLNLMQQEDNCVAILPQPFVSLSKLMVDDLRVPVSLTAEWNRAFADSGSQAVTTITLVNARFLEEHEQAVVEYLKMAGSSVAWTLSHESEAAALQEELGTFLNNGVAADALPQISLCCLTGTQMRTALSGFLEELHSANPDSIGGELPGDDFYYMPPEGAIDDDAVGLAEAQNAVQA